MPDEMNVAMLRIDLMNGKLVRVKLFENEATIGDMFDWVDGEVERQPKKFFQGYVLEVRKEKKPNVG